jgi:hypothetical protein
LQLGQAVTKNWELGQAVTNKICIWAKLSKQNLQHGQAVTSKFGSWAKLSQTRPDICSAVELGLQTINGFCQWKLSLLCTIRKKT